jgi:hypothetical protein
LKEKIDMTTKSMTMPIIVSSAPRVVFKYIEEVHFKKLDVETKEYFVMMGYDMSENKASPPSTFSIADGVEATITLSGGNPTVRLRVRTASEVRDLEYITPAQKIKIQERVNEILPIAQHIYGVSNVKEVVTPLKHYPVRCN